jgi:hemoglobin-like flavoprotein
MHLPSLDIEDANKLNLNEPLKQDLYEDFFDHYPNLINNFNEYLHANELPTINELIPQN